MAEKTLILGESGQGKSTSLRNCDPGTTAVVSPVGKRLPFKNGNKFTMLKGTVDTDQILDFIKEQAKSGKKLIVIDDFQYIMSVPYMHRIQESGWDKYNDFGKNYFDLLDICQELPEDVHMVYMSHTETLDDGITRIKLIGKLLREKITIEGLFETVLKAKKVDDKYYFITQSDGKDTIKSPMGMFETYAIDNDLAYVDAKVRNYYGLDGHVSDEIIAQMDAEKVADLAKPEKRSRKRSYNEVMSNNTKIVEKYLNDVDAKLDEISSGREEIPFDEASTVIASMETPELEKVPRRTKAERLEPDPEILEKIAESGDMPVEEHKPIRRTRKSRT